MASKRSVGFGIAALILVALGALLFYLPGGDDSAVRPDARPPETLTIFYTCDTRGHIEPCGCTTGMQGGLARRSTFVLSAATPGGTGATLLVDAGDVTGGGRPWEILELEFILRGYRQMGYHAVNVGHREAAMGREKLQDLKAKYDRFISANLLDQDGKTVFAPYRIVEMPGGFRVGVLGVMGDSLPPDQIGAGLAIIPPADAIARYLPEVQAKSHFVVLLCFAALEQMKALAERFYELRVIIGGKVKQPSGDPLTVNRSLIAYITDKGKSVGRLELSFAGGRKFTHKNEIVEMKESFADHPDIVRLIDEYKARLKELDFVPHKDDEEGLTSIAAKRSRYANRYLGADSCKSCHPQAYKKWAQSRHSRAFASLVKKSYQYNPRCLKCHTVGYAATDGYANERRTPRLKNVSCESCHGRGQYHVQFHAKQKIPAKRAHMKKANCLTCHDSDNSPKFSFQTYWEKIKHGKE